MRVINVRIVMGFSGMVVGGLLLTACGGASSNTSAAPTSSTSSAAAPAPVVDPTATSAPAETTIPVLGPNAYGKLKMGMTYTDAKAAGFVRERQAPPESGCGAYELTVGGQRDGHVFISADRGVEAIAPSHVVRTPEGVTPGWTLAKVTTVYRDMDVTSARELGRVYAKVPGNAKAVYRIGLDNDKVQDISLQLLEQKCYE